ncbi:MAG: heme-binding protein [Candidatus Thiodiazotropha sp.]
MGRLSSLSFTALILILLSSSANSEEPVSVSTHSLTGPMANKLALAVYDVCTKKGYNVAIAVVNRDGMLLAFVRNPLAGAHTIKVSQGKAWTAATFKTASQNLMGREFMKGIPGAMTWGGGLPINLAGIFYGGIGVAGAPAEKSPGDVDHQCASEGLDLVSEDIEFGNE